MIIYTFRDMGTSWGHKLTDWGGFFVGFSLFN